MITDVLDLRARVDVLAAQEVDARNQVSLSRVALSEIVGRPVTEKLSRVRSDVELKVSDESLDSWVQLARTNNPSIKANQSAVEAAEAGVRGGKGGHYPTLSLNLSAQNTNEGYNNAIAPRQTVMWPACSSLFQSIVVVLPRRVRGVVSGSGLSRAAARSNAPSGCERNDECLLDRRFKCRKIRANRNALASAEQSSIASEKAFTYGVVNAVDVLTSVQNEFKARRDLLKTQYDFITNLFILNRWAGKLTAESVESVNVWLSSNSKTDLVPDRNSKQ